jgi:hypothetical protein
MKGYRNNRILSAIIILFAVIIIGGCILFLKNWGPIMGDKAETEVKAE